MATDLGKVGMRTRGDWSSSATYELLDVVTYNNGLYIAKQAVPANTLPTNTTYWQKAIDADSIQSQIDTINGTLTNYIQAYTNGNASSIEKELETPSVYMFYTSGGGGRIFVWLVYRYGNTDISNALITGSAADTTLSITDHKVTVACTGTTIRMGYFRIG